MTGRVAWHRRIGVRLAILITVALIAFDFLAGYAFDHVTAWVGAPPVDTPLQVLHTDWVRSDFLEGGAAPTGERLDDWAEQLSDEGVAFVWLDPAGKVVCGTPGLPWSPGDRWDFPDANVQQIELRGRRVHTTTARVHDDGTLLGSFVAMLVDEERHDVAHDVAADSLLPYQECWFCEPEVGSIVLGEREWSETLARDERVATTLSILVMIASALLIGFAASRWITGRITRMAERAAAPIDGPELPGPFDSSGEDEISALAGAMNAMRERLAQRDVERREWTAQVSHDLRTPLTALLACLDRAESSLDDDASARELIQVARMDAMRVQDLTEDLLEIARLDANLGLRTEPVPPGELVRQVAASLGPLGSETDVNVETEVEPSLPILDADGSRLIRTLENLVRNAIRHARASVCIGAARVDDGVRFEVVDDGTGFGETDRLGESIDSGGLGLVVARRAVEAHGGRIEFENRPPAGACVWFVIPTPAGTG